MRLSDSRCHVASRSSEAMKLNLYGNATLIVYEYFRASVIMSYSRILVVSNVAELKLVRNAQKLCSFAFRCTNHCWRMREKKRKRENYVRRRAKLT